MDHRRQEGEEGEWGGGSPDRRMPSSVTIAGLMLLQHSRSINSRPSFAPVAFFHPSIKTDLKGVVRKREKPNTPSLFILTLLESFTI